MRDMINVEPEVRTDSELTRVALANLVYRIPLYKRCLLSPDPLGRSAIYSAERYTGYVKCFQRVYFMLTGITMKKLL